ncbi:class I SAM-dependent methyltransferase [Shewanella woodyi]|uniref:class I SAM-dependent methyltransferase n=1 Tax=Shewanella woodyi TaxID=60961 RepID=UPI0037488724
MTQLMSNESRVPETENGQQGEYIAEQYNLMQRDIRDHGWLNDKVELLINEGVVSGDILEVGMGPGYLGLEWLKVVGREGHVTGLDIAADMVNVARRNSVEYGLEASTTYQVGDALKMPFEDESFNHVISYGSLHEWNMPMEVFKEIDRVIRPGGRYCVIDLRRDLDRQEISFMRMNIATDMRKGFMSSVKASYTRDELIKMLSGSVLESAKIQNVPLALCVSGQKSHSKNSSKNKL